MSHETRGFAAMDAISARVSSARAPADAPPVEARSPAGAAAFCFITQAWRRATGWWGSGKKALAPATITQIASACSASQSTRSCGEICCADTSSTRISRSSSCERSAAAPSAVAACCGAPPAAGGGGSITVAKSRLQRSASRKWTVRRRIAQTAETSSRFACWPVSSATSSEIRQSTVSRWSSTASGCQSSVTCCGVIVSGARASWREWFIDISITAPTTFCTVRRWSCSIFPAAAPPGFAIFASRTRRPSHTFDASVAPAARTARAASAAGSASASAGGAWYRLRPPSRVQYRYPCHDGEATPSTRRWSA